MSYRHRERLDVYLEETDEEIEVWNFLNVDVPYQFRGGNPTMETFDPTIQMGGGGPVPDYITSWVAEELWDELSITESQLEDSGIEVIDMDADEITVL